MCSIAATASAAAIIAGEWSVESVVTVKVGCKSVSAIVIVMTAMVPPAVGDYPLLQQ